MMGWGGGTSFEEKWGEKSEFFFFPSNEKKQISSSSPADGPVARTCCIPIAHLLFSTTKMHGSLYRLAMLRHS